ncbi:hypothetical protein [Vibrio phage J14]|nr:hypothetical protein [Vibrio phage J14]
MERGLHYRETLERSPTPMKPLRFFYSMMEGLVKLGQRLQDATFDQEDLLSLIAQG